MTVNHGVLGSSPREGAKATARWLSCFMTPAYVYILYSTRIDKFYIGFTTEAPLLRLARHNEDYYDDKFTAKGKPWVMHHFIACESEVQARKIESHIKAMKSRKYLNDLKAYPAIEEKLKEKYSDC